MAKRKTLDPAQMTAGIRQLLDVYAPEMMDKAGIPCADTVTLGSAAPSPHIDYASADKPSPVLGVLFHPLTNDLPGPTDTDQWYPHYERVSLHLSGGYQPVIVRSYSHINGLQDMPVKRMAFGIVFRFGWFDVKAELMSSGIQSLCDDIGGLAEKVVIRVQSDRHVDKLDPIKIQVLTDSRAGRQRFREWVLRVTQYLIHQHVRSAAQHRKGIRNQMQAELAAQDQFHGVMQHIIGVYRKRFPGRTLRHTYVDVVNKPGLFTSLSVLTSGVPCYYEFQKYQAVFICLDLGKQLWLIVQSGKKGSIRSASNYIISMVCLRPIDGSRLLKQRAQALLDYGFCLAGTEQVRKAPRRQRVIVQSNSPAEEPG